MKKQLILTEKFYTSSLPICCAKALMVPSWSLVPKLMSIDHPCKMKNLTWASRHCLGTVAVFKTNNANTVGICNKIRICIKCSSTLTDPLEINRFVYFLPPTVRFDSKSHHLLYDKQPPEKKNALQVSSLSSPFGAFELSWRHCMWSHHIRCPSKAKHKFFAWSTSYAMFWFCQPKIQYMSVVCRICWGAFWRLEWWDDERWYFVTAGRLFAQHVPTSSTFSCNGVKNFIKIPNK